MKLKLMTSLAAAAIAMAACSAQKDTIPQTPKSRTSQAPYAQFSDGMLGSVEPMGWLRECLQRQNSGLTGHPKALSYPFTSCLWAGKITREGSHGSDWWRYEQTAYYTDGLLRLGYELRDSALIAKGEVGVNYTLSHPTDKGVLGVTSDYMLQGDLYSQWPFAVYFRAIQAMYQATGDERIPKALEKHYLQFPAELYKSRSAVNIEGVLWTYSLTGNGELLKLAEDAWALGSLFLNGEMCMSTEPLQQHGVTLCEELKLPMILYTYTGKKEYLQQALNAWKLISDYNMLPDGVPSSAESLCGKNPTHSHETCDIADWTWTTGYFLMGTGDSRFSDAIEKAVLNAGLGCVTKDFHQLQYFSSPNQFIATGTSNNNEFMRGRTWMAYRPTHQTECCAGNVHRIMPNYVARMWMRGRTPDSAVAALYGPSMVSYSLSDGTVCTITEITDYPFGDCIKFKFSFSRDGRRVRSHVLDFSFRLPEGMSCSDGYSFGENGFATLSRKFRSGEVLTVHLSAEPKAVGTEGGLYVQRGNIVFALPVEANVSVDTVTYSYMNGKKPDEPGFDCLNLTPASSWKWALSADPKPAFHRDAKKKGYPWEDSPVSVTIPATALTGWDLEDGVYTTVAPDSPVPAGEPARTITLEPYGSTLLRLTVFPVLK